MGVPSRRKNIEQNQKKLGVESGNIFYDMQKNGCMWNALRTWGSPTKEDTTHLLVLQDDVEVVDNFLEVCQVMIDTFPDAIFGLCDRSVTFSDKKEGTPYLKLRRCDVSGQAIIMPVKYINKFIAFYHKNLKGYPHDDGAIMMFAIINDVEVFTTIPSTVQHIEPERSVISHTHNSAGKISRVYMGSKSLAVEPFKTKDFGLSRKHPLDTGLNKNHPLQIQIKQKIKEEEK